MFVTFETVDVEFSFGANEISNIIHKGEVSVRARDIYKISKCRLADTADQPLNVVDRLLATEIVISRVEMLGGGLFYALGTPRELSRKVNRCLKPSTDPLLNS